ncbi:MAG: phospho-N-acetylmuramoyl-pentapeptide-transferase, partial [Treponema sp.]|nr:phospho-N-acetylmuramoyl-pentapeptide-transferase [Treponema sp.]
MLLEFVYPLVIYFTPFNVFLYLTFRGAYAALTTLLICFLFGGKVISALKRLKVGQSIRSDGPATHLVKAGTPTMGGLLVIGAVIIAMLLWGDLGNRMIWLTLISLVAFGVIGFIDDYLKVSRRNSAGLPAWGKLAGQFAAALAIVLYLYFSGGEETTLLYVPFLKNPAVDMGTLWIPFAVLLIMGESNAVNFSDGLDGLLAGL